MSDTRSAGALLARCRAAPWLCGWIAVSLAAVIAPGLATITVVKIWFDLTALVLAAAALAVGKRTCARICRVRHLAWLLPPADRPNWRGEVDAILHAVEHDPRQRRRETLGFIAATPLTAWTCWRNQRDRAGPDHEQRD